MGRRRHRDDADRQWLAVEERYSGRRQHAIPQPALLGAGLVVCVGEAAADQDVPGDRRARAAAGQDEHHVLGQQGGSHMYQHRTRASAKKTRWRSSKLELQHGQSPRSVNSLQGTNKISTYFSWFLCLIVSLKKPYFLLNLMLFWSWWLRYQRKEVMIHEWENC